MSTARISITNEREAGASWCFDVAIEPLAGAARQCTLKLSFADYNYWSASGTDAPSRVALAVIRFMLDRLEAAALPNAFDASLARRKFSDADEVIPTLISE